MENHGARAYGLLNYVNFSRFFIVPCILERNKVDYILIYEATVLKYNGHFTNHKIVTRIVLAATRDLNYLFYRTHFVARVDIIFRDLISFCLSSLSLYWQIRKPSIFPRTWLRKGSGLELTAKQLPLSIMATSLTPLKKHTSNSIDFLVIINVNIKLPHKGSRQTKELIVHNEQAR